MADTHDFNAEAERLVAEVGPLPGREGPDMVAWHRRQDEAAEKLAELAGFDGGALRHTLGPPVSPADSSPARDLLVLAAISCDLKSGFNRLKNPRS